MSVFIPSRCRSPTTRHLGGSSDSRGGGGHVLGLGLGLRLSLGGNLLLGGLLGLGLILDLVGGLLLGDGLLNLGLLGSLLLGLGGRGLAVDGSSELGEGALATLLLHLTLRRLALSRSRGLVALAESEGERRLALLLDVLLRLNDGGGGSLNGLGGDGGGVGDVDSEGSGGLNRRDHRGGLGRLGSVLGSLSRLSRLHLRALLLLAGEDAEDAVALGRSGLLLGALDGLFLNRLGLLDSGSSLGSRGLLGLESLGHRSNLGSGLSDNGSDNRGDSSGLKRSDGRLNNGSLDSRGIGDGSLLSGLDLLLLVLLLVGGRVTLAEAEERSSLAAGRSALRLLSLELLLLGLLLDLLLLGSFLGHNIVDGDDFLGLGLLLGSLGGLLLLLGNGSGLEALSGALVALGLGDGGSKLLGLGDLELQLSNPVVALSSAGGLEAVLVALGGEVELVGAIGLGLAGVGLWGASLE